MRPSILISAAAASFVLSSIVHGAIIDSDRVLDETYTEKSILVRDGLTPPTVVTVTKTPGKCLLGNHQL